MSVNRVTLLGRLGQDPDLRKTGTGKSVCKLSIATSEKWTDQFGQKQERTEWSAVIVWGKLAEHCNKYLSKGRECFVDGRLQTRQWEDKDGFKRYTTEVIATTVQFIGGNSQEGNQQRNNYGGNKGSQGQNNKRTQPNQYQVNTDSNYAPDDLPF